MLLVAIARREIQTEGLSSPPLGLGAAFLSAKIKVPPGAWHPSHLPRRTDCGLQEGSRRIPAPSKGKGCPASQGMAKQVTAGVGRMHQPLLYAPRATPHSLTAPLFPRCTFFREKKKISQSSRTCETFPAGETPSWPGQMAAFWHWKRRRRTATCAWRRLCTGKAREYQRQNDLFVISFKKMTQRKILLGRSVDANYSHLEETLILQ